MSTQSSASIELANQALDLAAKGELESAIAALESVIASQPNMVGARINLGALLCRFGAIERAIDCLKSTLELAPNFQLHGIIMAMHCYAQAQSKLPFRHSPRRLSTILCIFRPIPIVSSQPCIGKRVRRSDKECRLLTKLPSPKRLCTCLPIRKAVSSAKA